jgi:hypothetical protein
MSVDQAHKNHHHSPRTRLLLSDDVSKIVNIKIRRLRLLSLLQHRDWSPAAIALSSRLNDSFDTKEIQIFKRASFLGPPQIIAPRSAAPSSARAVNKMSAAKKIMLKYRKENLPNTPSTQPKAGNIETMIGSSANYTAVSFSDKRSVSPINVGKCLVAKEKSKVRRKKRLTSSWPHRRSNNHGSPLPSSALSPSFYLKAYHDSNKMPTSDFADFCENLATGTNEYLKQQCLEIIKERRIKKIKNLKDFYNQQN